MPSTKREIDTEDQRASDAPGGKKKKTTDNESLRAGRIIRIVAWLEGSLNPDVVIKEDAKEKLGLPVTLSLKTRFSSLVLALAPEDGTINNELHEAIGKASVYQTRLPQDYAPYLVIETLGSESFEPKQVDGTFNLKRM
eukprot:scaffold15966_cov52-Attheya_sp.AAC.3